MERPEKAREKGLVSDFQTQRALRGLQKYHTFGFTVDDLSVVYVKKRANGEEKRMQVLKRNVHIPSNGKANT